MITITIGEEMRAFGETTEQWITQQITRRRRDDGPLCVQVRIDEPHVRLLLSTPQCQRNGGGGGMPNDREQMIIDLWQKRGLNSNNFTGGNLIAFLKQLKP